MRRLQLRAIGGHLARLGLSAGTLGVAQANGSAPLAAAGAIGMFFEVFAATHDVAHGALGLSRRANEVGLGVVGALMFTSGHAMRRMHLEHHRDELGPRDLEGAPARGSFTRAALLAPIQAVALRREAYRRAGATGRQIQAYETALCAALFVACLASGSISLVAYALACVAAHGSAAVWATFIPHHTPRWLSDAAATLAFTGSPTVLALAFHDVHHARPGLPTAALPAAARSLSRP